MSGLVGAVGRVGAVGGARAVAVPPMAATPDFTLSSASFLTQWDVVTVGQLLPVGAPAGVYFLLVESAAASGDEAGLAVVNG